MPVNVRGFQPGQVANPNGRPQIGRALAEILRAQGDVKPRGKRLARNQNVARMLWELAADGQSTFPDGKVIRVGNVRDWLAIVQFIHNHVDGPVRESATANVQVNVKAYVNFSPDEWDDQPTIANATIDAQPITIDMPASVQALPQNKKRKPTKRASTRKAGPK